MPVTVKSAEPKDELLSNVSDAVNEIDSAEDSMEKGKDAKKADEKAAHASGEPKPEESK